MHAVIVIVGVSISDAEQVQRELRERAGPMVHKHRDLSQASGGGARGEGSVGNDLRIRGRGQSNGRQVRSFGPSAVRAVEGADLREVVADAQ